MQFSFLLPEILLSLLSHQQISVFSAAASFSLALAVGNETCNHRCCQNKSHYFFLHCVTPFLFLVILLCFSVFDSSILSYITTNVNMLLFVFVRFFLFVTFPQFQPTFLVKYHSFLELYIHFHTFTISNITYANMIYSFFHKKKAVFHPK